VIAVTGVGTISAAGSGCSPLRAALRTGRPALSAIGGVGCASDGGSRRAALVPAAILEETAAGLDSRRHSPPSRLAVAAARAALAQAGLAKPSEADPGLAVVAATAFGPSSFTGRLFDQILDEGPACASPALFAECVANAAAAQVSEKTRASGPGLTLSQGEAGALSAVSRAAGLLASGRAVTALAGAVEEMPPLVHALLDRCGALARPGSDGDECARPFDRRRDGFHAAEGGTFLVLEEEAAARRRGAVVLARLRGGFSAFDATAPAGGWGRGEALLGHALRRGLERLHTSPARLDLIVSGASGSRAGDRLEAATLRAAWRSEPLPPVLVPKAVTGEYGGAFLAAAVLAAEEHAGWDAPWFAEPDEDCGVRPHTGPLQRAPRTILVSSLAAGGCASWLVLEAAS
jgi:3-oxoacyl-(acyl-carrier-protein) synthase